MEGKVRTLECPKCGQKSVDEGNTPAWCNICQCAKVETSPDINTSRQAVNIPHRTLRSQPTAAPIENRFGLRSVNKWQKVDIGSYKGGVGFTIKDPMAIDGSDVLLLVNGIFALPDTFNLVGQRLFFPDYQAGDQMWVYGQMMVQ